MAFSVAIHFFGLHLHAGVWSLPFILLSSTLVFMAFHVNHNHMHLNIFNWMPFNWIVNGWLSIAIAWPVSGHYVPHLVNHHPNYCNDLDWTGHHLAGDTRGPYRILHYNTLVLWSFIKTGRAFTYKNMPRFRKISTLFEFTFLAAFLSYAFSISSLSSFLLHFFLPTAIGLQGMIFMNFFVHDGCDPESRLNSCRSFISFVPNLLTVNNGFHLVHHEFPAEHWSRLPRIHAEHYANVIEPRYVHSSAGRHFYLHYVLGKSFD